MSNIENFVQNHLHGEINQPQIDAFNWATDAHSQQILLVMGAAGTGKSTFVNALEEYSGLKILRLAPTGMAALNFGGVTIHSMFQFYIPSNSKSHGVLTYQTNQLRTAWSRSKEVKAAKMELIRSVDLIVIDEVSMVRCDVMRYISMRMNSACGTKGKSFGGKKLLLMGDLYQLPPIVKKIDYRVLTNPQFGYSGSFFFTEIVPPIKRIEFTHNYRQGDDLNYSQFLNKVRDATAIQKDIDWFNNSTVKEPTECTILAHARKDVNDHNQKRLDELESELIEIKGIYSGKVDGRTTTGLSHKMELKVGARVMFTLNDKDFRFVNGTTGYIDYIGEDYIDIISGEKRICLERFTEEHKEPKILNLVDGETTVSEVVTGSIKQFPIKLAWSITIHKSQGSTLDHVSLYLTPENVRSEALIYVALSRVKNIQSISINRPLRLQDIKASIEVKNWLARNE